MRYLMCLTVFVVGTALLTSVSNCSSDPTTAAGLLQVNGDPPCPTSGSAADGVATWTADNCTTQCVGLATTCNGEFTIEFLGASRDGTMVTFDYRVCKLDGAPADLGYWVLSLDQLLDCAAAETTLEALVVECRFNDTIGGAECGTDPTHALGLDTPTQLDGLLWTPDNTELCNDYSITVDEAGLEAGFVIEEGCVLAATRAGDQDITLAEQAIPGYACVTGPICTSMPADDEEEGCGPGFWKNHPEEWPIDDVALNTIFTFPMSLESVGDSLLSEALRFKGGPTVEDAAKNTLRHAVAAYLNASHEDLNFPMTQMEIVEAVNEALASEDRQTILHLKSDLHGDDDLDCPFDEDDEEEEDGEDGETED